VPSLETIWNLARPLLIGILLAVLLIRLFEDKMIFFPDSFAAGTWNTADYGVETEDAFFPTSDGLQLHAWWAPAAGETSHTIIYFHGNAGNLTNRIDNVGFLQRLPANVLAVDYRGYGRSEGRPSEQGIYLDALAAYDYLTKERSIPPEQVVVLGQSLGSAAATDLASRRRLAGVILEAGFPSARRVAQVTMLLPGIPYLIRSKFDSAAKLKKIRVPVLVAHCTADSVLPYKLGEELFAAANQPKTFVSYNAFCHEPLYIAAPADYAAKLRAFLESTRLASP
jgi:fermentation-respiration switch protein FrsA (DUF1100 family)